MISIDFWNTLVKAETGGEARRNVRINALRKVAYKYAGNLPYSEIDNAKRKTSQEFDRIWFGEQRTPTTDELVQKILEHLEIPATPEERTFLVEAFQESLWEGAPELAPMVPDVVPALAERYPLAVISDTMYSPGKIIRRYLQEKKILEYFQCFVFSDETGYSKPNPKAFRKVLRETECDAGSSWHIGDLIETDVRGAKEVGMRTILYTGFSGQISRDREVEPDFVCVNWEEIADLLI